MSIVINELPICKLKKTDLLNINTIIKDFMSTGEYYGRKDYWDKSMDRIDEWLNAIENIAYDNGIRLKENK